MTKIYIIFWTRHTRVFDLSDKITLSYILNIMFDYFIKCNEVILDSF